MSHGGAVTARGHGKAVKWECDEGGGRQGSRWYLLYSQLSILSPSARDKSVCSLSACGRVRVKKLRDEGVCTSWVCTCTKLKRVCFAIFCDCGLLELLVFIRSITSVDEKNHMQSSCEMSMPTAVFLRWSSSKSQGLILGWFHHLNCWALLSSSWLCINCTFFSTAPVALHVLIGAFNWYVSGLFQNRLKFFLKILCTKWELWSWFRKHLNVDGGSQSLPPSTSEDFKSRPATFTCEADASKRFRTLDLEAWVRRPLSWCCQSMYVLGCFLPLFSADSERVRSDGHYWCPEMFHLIKVQAPPGRV